MKKYFRIMALLACTAALCVSALAAGTEAPADHAYVPNRVLAAGGHHDSGRRDR